MAHWDRERHRKSQAEYSSLPGCAANPNSSVMVLDDTLDDPKSKSSSFFAFAGHKWLEHRSLQLRQNTGASVGHAQLYPAMQIVRCLNLLCLDNQLAPSLKAITRVHHQIGK